MVALPLGAQPGVNAAVAAGVAHGEGRGGPAARGAVLRGRSGGAPAGCIGGPGAPRVYEGLGDGSLSPFNYGAFKQPDAVRHGR